MGPCKQPQLLLRMPRRTRSPEHHGHIFRHIGGPERRGRARACYTTITIVLIAQIAGCGQAPLGPVGRGGAASSGHATGNSSRGSTGAGALTGSAWAIDRPAATPISRCTGVSRQGVGGAAGSVLATSAWLPSPRASTHRPASSRSQPPHSSRDVSDESVHRIRCAPTTACMTNASRHKAETSLGWEENRMAWPQVYGTGPGRVRLALGRSFVFQLGHTPRPGSNP